jgi:hypothetical protein
MRICVRVGEAFLEGRVLGRPEALDAKEQKTNDREWTAWIASPTTRLSSSGSPAASAIADAAAHLTGRFSYDCLGGLKLGRKRGKSACGVYLPDREQPRPPAAPPGMVKLRLVKKAEG